MKKSFLLCPIGLLLLGFGCMKDSWDTDLRDNDRNIILDKDYTGALDDREMSDLRRHFDQCGVKIEGVGPLYAENAMADAGRRYKIGDRFIGVYKYNLKKRNQRQKFEKIKEEQVLYLIGIPFRVYINGHFVMIDADTHEDAEKIISAFQSFD